MRRIIAFISERWRDQPSLDDMARQVGLSTTHVHHPLPPLVRADAESLSPGDHPRQREGALASSASVLDTTYELGLSGPGRLHDLFVAHEAMTPGDFAAGGAGLVMRFGFHLPFGEAILIATARGLAGLGFVDDGDRATALDDMRRRWPKAQYAEDQAATAPSPGGSSTRAAGAEQPLRIVMIGTDFEVRVWETLLRIPLGQATTYSDIATRIGRPTASRAVGAAVGKNPISFVVPCHRVLGRSGALTGYHWGLTRKQAILGWEAGARSR